MKFLNGDCLEEMDKLIEQGVKVDAIICDLPYGTTKCKWDIIIPFDKLWEKLNKLIKDNGAIVLFGSEPFSSKLRMSNIDNFKYDWVWEKEQGVNFQNCHNQPLKIHELISVFNKKGFTYYPQNLIKSNIKKSNKGKGGRLGHHDGDTNRKKYVQEFTNYPNSILKFKRETGLHPTQKPKELLRYLVKTYTNKYELVLDMTMGSGTTGVVCKEEERDFIGIEKEKDYFNISVERINKTCVKKELGEWFK